jgi:aspartate/methionine/tyrosine aminotransferase
LADDETRSAWRSLTLGYTEPGGHPRLRREIASLYDGLDATHVMTCAGAQEGIFLAMNVLVDAGDHAVVVTPAYQSLHEVARAIGATVTTVDLDPADWSLDIDRLERAITDRTRVVVINFPHSPTGAQISVDSLQRIARMCEARGIHLFSDEVYRFLELDVADRLPPAASLSASAISLGVMSKAFGLAGLRVGWIATRDTRVLDRIAAFKDYTTICNSAPSETLALMALRARDQVLARSRAIVAANVPLLDEFFQRHISRFAWIRPRAGSVCFPRLLRENADEFADRLVNDAGTLVVPGSHFQYDASYFRIGYGRRDMPEALAQLEAFVSR